MAQSGREPTRVRLESDTLYALIGVVASSPSLDRVLSGMVALLTEATDCHACFVYLREGDRLRMRAASGPFGHLVGRVEFGVAEGIAGWVAREGRPAFIREDAMSDPRMKYVPELEEERFQSMVAVPIPARSGEVIGVVVLHTQAPREFEPSVGTFLAHTASLAAGAIENAQLYDDARRRVERLTTLSGVGERLAAAVAREELYRVATSGVRSLLRCELCQLFLVDAHGGRLELVATDPQEGPPEAAVEGTAVLFEVLRRRGGVAGATAQGLPILAAAVAAGERHLGVLAAVGGAAGAEEEELLRAVAHQLAIALARAELIERLTAENLVRDILEALAGDRVDVAEARARTADFDLARRTVIVHVGPATGAGERPPWASAAERVEARIRRLAPGALFDPTPDGMRGLVPLRPGATDEDVATLERGLDEAGRAESVLIGISDARRGVADGRRALAEARDAGQIARALVREGGALAYRDLGAYKYLVQISTTDGPRDRHVEAVEKLAEYDRRRRSDLVPTLERYLRDRRSVTSTARALFIHPNTLRQRLDRIERLSGLQLAEEDLLALELAIKLARLRATA
jgi:GAF domain-containing protein